ncbi:PP2C family protein-serine/threonine phosphatase [Bacilliculturomica massiliensis]|uniref:PP2C family protein-serine/threonine phosphatase n=1 Tax=Bacilliculturomica massiliensis TaxID=1917867 RepID=UPI00102F85CA|nr:PP2C family protein-serine/threonine phosphatase [Bacilliculturomica massiliensis]
MNQTNGNSLMYDVIERMDYMVRVMDEESNIIYMNRKMRGEFGDKTGKKCFELLSSEGKCINCVSMGCKMSQNAETKDVRIGTKVYRIIASPVSIAKKEKFSVEIFEDVTEQTRIMEENLRNYEKLKKDVDFAKQIQIRALPADGAYWDALEIQSCYRPSEALGGDIFDLVRIDDNRSLFYIADVSGHGIRSSLLTIFLRQIIRGMKVEAGDLNNILKELLSNYNDLKMGNEQYFSILIGLYDREASEVTFINAGHNCLPLIIRRDGTKEEISVGGMPVCGLMKKAEHEQVQVKVSAGDRIFLYTDGITEAYSEEKKQAFGFSGVMDIIDSEEEINSGKITEKIVRQACEFVSGEMLDDMAVVMIKIL